MLLTSISPVAAKIYLILSTLTKPHADPPIAQVPLKTLARLANLAPRTCSVALRQLLDVQMLTRLPRRDAAPTAYILAPLHYAHPDALTAPDAHPAAPPANTKAHPDAHSSSPHAHPHAPSPTATSVSTPETHKAHQDAPNTTKPVDDPLLNPALLQLLMSTLSPQEISTLLAPFQSAIASLTDAAKKEAPDENPGLGKNANV